MIFASFSDSFKCFHTVDTFAAFDRVMSLFGTYYLVFSLIRPKTERVFFAIFGRTISVASLQFSAVADIYSIADHLHNIADPQQFE